MLPRMSAVMLCCAFLSHAQVINPSGSAFSASQAGHWIIGKAWSQRFSGTTGCGPVQYKNGVTNSWIGPMPANFRWSGAGLEFELAGAFSAAGCYGFTLRQECGVLFTESQYSIRVNEPFAMIDGPSLPLASVGVQYQAPLTKGGALDFAARMVSGALPTGCTLFADTRVRSLVYDGVANDYRKQVSLLCPAQAAEGVYSFEVQASDGFGTTGTAKYALVRAASGEFYTSTKILSFLASPGGAVQTRPVAVGSGDLSPVKFTAASDAAWLAVTPGSATTPEGLTVQVDPSKLPEGTHTAHFTVTPAGDKQPVTVTVNANIVSAAAPSAPGLGVAPESAEIELQPDSFRQTHQLVLAAWNDGSGALTARADVLALWKGLSVEPGQFTLAPGEVKGVTVTLDAGQLVPGTYQASIQVRSGMQTRLVPVTVVVPKPNFAPRIRVEHFRDFDHQTFCRAFDNTLASVICHRLHVLNDIYQTPLDFTVGFSGPKNWIISPVQGRIEAHPDTPAVKAFEVFAGIPDQQVAAGRYEGLVTFIAPGAVGSPVYAKLTQEFVPNRYDPQGQTHPGQWNFAVANPVTRHVVGQGSAATLKLVNPLNVPVSFKLSSAPEVKFAPSSGIIAAADTTEVKAELDDKALDWPAVMALLNSLRGPVTLATRPIQVGTPTTGQSGGKAPAAAGCVATKLLLGVAEPPTYFRWLADSPMRIGAAVYDDCAAPVTDASVTASFSNGDAGLALSLKDNAAGLYQSGWAPGTPSEDVTVTLRALKGNLTPAVRRIYGAIVEEAGSPVIFNGGMVNNLNPVRGAAASPGLILSIYGKNMAGSTAVAESAPLPRQLAGTRVLMGGIEAPLYYASPGLINAQVPAELAADASYSVVVLAGERIATPKTLRVAKVAPGIAAFPGGRVIAQHLNYTLITPDSPAKPGEYIILYLVGLGATTPVVPTGTAAPLNPLAMVIPAPMVTIGGEQAEVVFAGMTPGAVGLYQIVGKVPDAAASGDLPLVVTQEGVAANSVTVPVTR